MTALIDSVDAYLPEAGSIDKAARIPGGFLTWCANMHLLSTEFEQEHERLLVRLRYREVDPSELFIAGCAGEFVHTTLSDDGVTFARRWYHPFAARAPELAEGKLYASENEWWLYERFSAYLTPRLLGKKPQGRQWWQFWK